MKIKTVNFSDIAKHGTNLSAKFWVNHDTKNCKVCCQDCVIGYNFARFCEKHKFKPGVKK